MGRSIIKTERLVVRQPPAGPFREPLGGHGKLVLMGLDRGAGGAQPYKISTSLAGIGEKRYEVLLRETEVPCLKLFLGLQ